MKKIATSILASSLILGGLIQASAAPVLRFSADGGATWTVVVDNGPLDGISLPGFISYDGLVGDWYVNTESAIGAPLAGTALAPVMDLGTDNQSSNTATLIVQMSDINFTAIPNETFIPVISGITGGTVTFNTYRDPGNVLFGTKQSYSGDPAGVSPSATALVLSKQGPFAGGSFLGSNVVVVSSSPSPYSLTLETIIVHTGPATTLTDGSIETLPPPPCNCTLSFNSPTTITNCPDDVIPDVTASQNCGSGWINAPVTPGTITTNGVCPLLVTRNYTATDNCGTVYPFSQLVVINCKPNCTITPSVTTAMVGDTNSASVADAGVGAIYNWSVLNGSVVSGQNTPTIKWKAGTDLSSPVTIIVTITAPTGCQSTCTACVKLTPQPPKKVLSGGDAATIGFWHNKNGQGIINGASNSPALGNWLATSFPCLYGPTAPAGDNLTGKANSVVAALFMTKFGATGQAKQESQIMAVALACYFTSTSHGGGAGPVKFGFNQSTGGTGDHTINVGQYGTALGLTNNTSYTILQILQAANNVRCGNPSAPIPYDLFNAINTTGDIN